MKSTLIDFVVVRFVCHCCNLQEEKKKQCLEGKHVEKKKEDKNLPFLFMLCPCHRCTKSLITNFVIVEVL